MEKKRKRTTIFIVILILLVLGLSGYIVYDKFLNKEEKVEKVETIEDEETVEVSENLDVVAQTLVDKLDKYYVDYYDDQDEVDFSSLDDKDLIQGAYVYENDLKLTKTKVYEYYKSLFGRTLSNYPDFNCWAGDGALYKYNANIGEYEQQEGHGHGGLCTMHSSFIKYNNIQKAGENYIITVTKVYGPSQGMCLETPENAFYADSKYTVKIDELSEFAKTDIYGNWSNSDVAGAKEYYEQNYEQFKNVKPQYKYTFTKKGDDYYLVNYEKIK